MSATADSEDHHECRRGHRSRPVSKRPARFALTKEHLRCRAEAATKTTAYSIDPSYNVTSMRGTFPNSCSATQLKSTTSVQIRAEMALATALDQSRQAAPGSEHTYWVSVHPSPIAPAGDPPSQSSNCLRRLSSSLRSALRSWLTSHCASATCSRCRTSSAGFSTILPQNGSRPIETAAPLLVKSSSATVPPTETDRDRSMPPSVCRLRLPAPPLLPFNNPRPY